MNEMLCAPRDATTSPQTKAEVPPLGRPRGTVAFTVYAKAVGQQRARWNPTTGRTPHTPAKSRAARLDVQDAWCAAVEGATDIEFPWEGPVAMAVRVMVRAPKDHWPGRACMRTPDWDNLGKLVSDALNGFAYRDDRQISDGRVVRVYGERDQTEVELTFFDPIEKPRRVRRR